MTNPIDFAALPTKSKIEEPANEPEPPGITGLNSYQIRAFTEFIMGLCREVHPTSGNYGLACRPVSFCPRPN